MIWMLTSVMPAVSNTSPLSNLAVIERLELLREQFGTVTVPAGVWAELRRLPNLEAKASLKYAMRSGWLRVVSLAGPVPDDLAFRLDQGEAEALALALETKARLVLLDESAARLKAKQIGIPCTGVLGILRKARTDGRIPSLKAEILRLRSEARFFVSRGLEDRLLASVGEI
jgi:predicted nucleic acid-binding protein